MNAIRQSLLALLIFTSLSMSAGIIMSSSCNAGSITINATKTGTGTSEEWTLIRNGVEIYYQTGGVSFSKTYTAAEFVNGYYYLKLRQLVQNEYTIWYSTIDYYSMSTEYVNLGYPAGQSNFNYCSNPDSSALDIYVQAGKWTSGTCSLYASTGFGSYGGYLLRSAQLTENHRFNFPNRLSFFYPTDYIKVVINVFNGCKSGTRTFYLHNMGDCPSLKTTSDILSLNSENENVLDFFPNPVESTIQLSRDLSEFSKVELYSSQGILIEEINLAGNTIDFNDKQAGLYYLKAYEVDGSVKTSKITKK